MKAYIITVLVVIPIILILLFGQNIIGNFDNHFINDNKLASVSRSGFTNTSNSNKYKIASFPRSVMAVEPQKVGGEEAHVIDIKSSENMPSYRYEFLNSGVRILIDKKDGKGFIQAVGSVVAIPELESGNDWKAYSLKTNTKGGNVLSGFDKKENSDGTTILTRTFSATQEGTTETFTERWTVPKTVEEFAKKGPKAEYEMTKNRSGVWRMRWENRGISDITKDNFDIRDEDNWPIRKKEYMDGLFRVDVNDFDNLYDRPMFTYSELAKNQTAEVIFFKDGTNGDRIIDPTVVISNIALPWIDSTQRIVFYNGENFCIIYTKNDTSVFYKCASTTAGLSGATEQTLLNGIIVAGTGVSTYMVSDSKFDIGYSDSGAGVYLTRTCTISGSTIACGNASGEVPDSTGDIVHVARASSTNRIYMTDVGSEDLYRADQTGDAQNITTWTQVVNNFGNNSSAVTIAPYGSSDKILIVFDEDPGGTSSDGIYYIVCDTSCTSATRFATITSPTAINVGNLIRISDTDFRFVYVDANSDVIEAKFDGNSTWSSTHATVHTGTDESPSMFYDRVIDQSFVLYEDSADDIWYHQKTCTSNDGCSESAWGTQTNADNNEGDANVFPVTQMHESPDGSSRTAPLEFPWCYLNANDANFDVVCDSLNLAAAENNAIKINGGVNIRGGTSIIND